MDSISFSANNGLSSALHVGLVMERSLAVFIIILEGEQSYVDLSAYADSSRLPTTVAAVYARCG